LAGCIVVPNVVAKIPLHAAHFLIPFFCEFALHANHGFKAGIKVWNTQLEELGQFSDQLIIENIEQFLGVVVFLLCLSKGIVK
jgi:hypothetical protein